MRRPGSSIQEYWLRRLNVTGTINRGRRDCPAKASLNIRMLWIVASRSLA